MLADSKRLISTSGLLMFITDSSGAMTGIYWASQKPEVLTKLDHNKFCPVQLYTSPFHVAGILN